MTTNVVIADDHLIVREGLRAVLNQDPDINVVAECGDGAEAIVLARVHRPDVVLMDLRMPGVGGAEAARVIIENGHAAVLVLTTYDTDGDVTRAIAAGASGYLLKDAAKEDLIAAIHATASGETVLSPLIAARLAKRLTVDVPHLTVRETEVLQAIASGKSNPEIGRQLYITEATVKSHAMRIFSKLGVKDRTAAVTTAIARGILPPPSW